MDELLSPDTSRKEVEILWGALRSCYGTESEAVAAAARNTGTILPYLNSPSNIKGCYAVLVEMMGSEQAGDVCAKNPGILQCNPQILALEHGQRSVAVSGARRSSPSLPSEAGSGRRCACALWRSGRAAQRPAGGRGSGTSLGQSRRF